MSDKILDHIKSEINFVEEKINHLTSIIDGAYHNEVRQYFVRQQSIMNDIRSELYNLGQFPMAEMNNKSHIVNPAQNAYNNQTQGVGINTLR